MKVIYDLKKVKKFRRPVVALGVFDGVHRAHRHILQEAVKEARRIRGTSIVVTFWPHPQGQESLYSLEHRLRLIEELGIDAAVVIHFTKRFSKISAEEFVKNIVVKKLRARAVFIGRNFRFGHRAQGDFRLLRLLSGAYDFQLKVFNVVTQTGQAISSTSIRRLITGGKLRAAQQLLGRPVSVYGTVIQGSSVGRRLGFPTANINPPHEILPPSGIYAVKVTANTFAYRRAKCVASCAKLKGACYIGTKPTFEKYKGQGKARYVEVHIFGFNKDLYGNTLDIQFIKKIREDKKFNSISALVAQIKKDIARVKSSL